MHNGGFFLCRAPARDTIYGIGASGSGAANACSYVPTTPRLFRVHQNTVHSINLRLFFLSHFGNQTSVLT